jgi:8-oxo-dGTP diphosphatase
MGSDLKKNNSICLTVFALIFNDKNEFSLVRTKPSEKKLPEYESIWSMPGGKIKYGEPVIEALEREIFEETGLRIISPQLIGYAETIKDGKHYVSLNFQAQSVGNAINIGDSNEIDKCEWFSAKTLPDNISINAKRFLKELNVI